jgi:3-phenylpropionate/cinnamic acid dioxygenase small subunit
MIPAADKPVPSERPAPTSDLSRALEVADFLFQEAELLDARCYDQWLALFADELVYWLPASEREEPKRSVSIVYDDRARLTERVRRLQRGLAPSVQPPSRTTHVLGNVRVSDDGSGVLRATSRCLVAELRVGREQLYAATVEHHLVDSGAGLRIAAKIVRLSRRDVPLGNLSFLF